MRSWHFEQWSHPIGSVISSACSHELSELLSTVKMSSSLSIANVMEDIVVMELLQDASSSSSSEEGLAVVSVSWPSGSTLLLSNCGGDGDSHSTPQSFGVPTNTMNSIISFAVGVVVTATRMWATDVVSRSCQRTTHKAWRHPYVKASRYYFVWNARATW